MAQSAILRLPQNLRSVALLKLSRNANSPGGSARQTLLPGGIVRRRGQKAAISGLAARLGIVAIESSPGLPLQGVVGTANSVAVTISTGGGSPASTVITGSEEDQVTWATGGPKALQVTSPAGLFGNGSITV